MVRGHKRFYISKEELAEQLLTKTYNQIAKERGVDHGSVRWCAQRYGIAKPSRFWSKEEIESLRNSYYAGKNSVKSKRTLSGIYHKVSRLGIKKQVWQRKHQVNEGFFNAWTIEMAYVLGWLCSDGYVSVREDCFSLHLQARDGYILEKIRSIMQYAGPIQKYNPKYSMLRINSHLLTSDLIKLGCTPRKSWTLRFPLVPEEFLSHFVRGYFDGDGSIMFNKPNVIKISFLGSEEFLKELRFRLHCTLGVKLNPITLGNIYQLYYYGDDARTICSWMYRDAQDLYLNRKKDRFDKHLKLRQNNGLQTSASTEDGS